MQKCAVISEFSIFGILAERLESSQAMHGPVLSGWHCDLPATNGLSMVITFLCRQGCGNDATQAG